MQLCDATAVPAIRRYAAASVLTGRHADRALQGAVLRPRVGNCILVIQHH